MEGNLNYFGGGPECKKPTSGEHLPLRREPQVAREGAPPGLASYSNIARGRAYPVLSRDRLGRPDDLRALLAGLAGILSSEELGDVSAEDDDGWLGLHGLREIGLIRGVRTERHLLRPYDVLVTARAGSVQVVLVPPDVSRTVAGITMLVVRSKQPEPGMGHWLWYFLTSAHGQAQLARRITVSATLKSLSARNLGEVEVPVPSPRDLDTIARLVEASESAYTSAVEAARLRRDALRDSLIKEIERKIRYPNRFR